MLTSRAMDLRERRNGLRLRSRDLPKTIRFELHDATNASGGGLPSQASDDAHAPPPGIIQQTESAPQ
ncbi:MAG: hypothetical protein QM775_13820 [Pirellulales bacterium]